ncbi:TPA: hypothetical protein ACPEZQ_004998 [Escherichia coli]
MPTKHIDTTSWNTVESVTVRAIELNGKLVKETDVIRLLIERGAKTLTDDDLRNINGFKPNYGVMSWSKDGTITDFGTIEPEEYAAYLAANQPVMTCVYGNTATGKTNFKDSLLRCISDDMAENFLVEDEDNGRISEDTRLHLFKSFFDEGRNVVFVEHAHNCSCMITRFVNAMASSKVNFIFIGEVGPARKAKMIKTARYVIMKLSENYPYKGVYEKCLV